MSATVVLLCTEGLDVRDYELCASRVARIAKARTPQIALESLGAEVAFLAAAKIAGIAPQYHYLADGRPQPEAAGYFMSLTHTRELCACAIADMPVGIDAEGARRILPSLAKKILAPAETGELRAVWVKKESYLKRTGEGLRRSMHTFSLQETDGYFCDLSHEAYAVSVCLAQRTEVEEYFFTAAEVKRFLMGKTDDARKKIAEVKSLFPL